MNNRVNVRVRGIFATALTKILLDNGANIVEASDKIQERMGIKHDTSPCDVTVKDGEYQDELVVIGFPEKAREIYDLLTSSLRYVFTWVSKVELHSVYIGLVKEKRGNNCLIDIGGHIGSLVPCKENVGEKVLVGVKRAPIYPGEELTLTKNFRIMGKYMAIIHGDSRISFSEHVRDPEIRARLSAIAVSRLMNTGLGIHFRSSSKYASKDNLLGELDSLINEYKKLFTMLENVNEPRKIYPGEFIGIIGLTSLAKRILDEIRQEVYPTMPCHHSYKALGYADLVDLAERIMNEQCDRFNAWRGFTMFILDKINEKKTVEFLHIKPSGERIHLSPGHVIAMSHEKDGVKLIVKRVISSTGIYDGIGVEKKPGDVDYVVIDTRKPFIVHNYYREGIWLGSYVNVNTPPEVAPGVVKYHDLLVDVVIKPDGVVNVIDKEELSEYYRMGIITKELYEFAENSVKMILENPLSHVYNPFTDSK